MRRSLNTSSASYGMLLCCLGFLSGSSEGSIRRAPFTAFAQATFPTAFPQHATSALTSEVEMKPDLEAVGFSAQNAVFFASLSRIAYSPKNEAMGLVKGNSTCEGLGFDRFHWFEAGEDAKESAFDAIHDTEAFVAANDDIIAVVFRGTKEVPDWAANLNALRRDCPTAWGFSDPGCSMHQGFDDGVETVWEARGRMRKVVKDLYNEKNKDRKLYIAGHSLGGALATLTAARLAFEDGLDIAGVYTIGSPRLFDAPAAASFDAKLNHGVRMKDKYFRCRNNNDVVPRLPLSLTHVGTEIYLDRFGAISTASFMDRTLGRFSALLRGQVIDGINDHAAGEYIRHFQQVVINSRVPLGEKAASTLSDAFGNLVLKVAPQDFIDRNESLQKLQSVKSDIEVVKDQAKQAADKEAALEF